ncbi:MAG TPA: hypothetical protein VJN02_03140 [Gammaproteobacteria bacterium]|nr:hypothetical protein [Gammaproteobacteria bacterium]
MQIICTFLFVFCILAILSMQKLEEPKIEIKNEYCISNKKYQEIYISKYKILNEYWYDIHLIETETPC